MRHFARKTKIVATIGPASDTVEMLQKLITAGINVARVNMSHGTYEEQAQKMKRIRDAAASLDREVAILLDLQGPKIRVDRLETPLQLRDGQEWYIGESSVVKKHPELKDRFIPTIYKKLVSDCLPGQRVLFDDGYIIGKIIDKTEDMVKITVTVGGDLKSNKGINLPDTQVTAPSFTEKDRQDLEFGLTQDIDYIALSFVRTARDILDVKEMLKSRGFDIPIISKIEKPQALDNIEEILSVTDGIMVARGDMAVEIGNHLVPAVQKNLIRRCNQLGIPVITATQMMESMITNPTPTRAEASDVANAVWDGTDAVMLSAESASGKYPVEAVTMMDMIVEEAEKTPSERPLLRNMNLEHIGSATMVAASMIAEKIHAKRILAITNTGKSCLEISHFRPTTKVLGITDKIKAMRRMCLYWGISPFFLKDYDDSKSKNIEQDIIEEVMRRTEVKKGDKIVIVKGSEKFFVPGTSNTVKATTIE